MKKNIKYFILNQEPTDEQYALTNQTPENIVKNSSETKWLLKCDCEGIPKELLGEEIKLLSHDEFIKYVTTEEWSG